MSNPWKEATTGFDQLLTEMRLYGMLSARVTRARGSIDEVIEQQAKLAESILRRANSVLAALDRIIATDSVLAEAKRRRAETGEGDYR